MAVNYAAKYESKVDERFKLKSLTEAAVNREYDWVGVDTIYIYSIPTVPLENYTVTGANRYGTPTELGNDKQTCTLTQDKSFSITIDRKSQDDTVGAMQSGKALARQQDEVITPTIDTYRLKVMHDVAVANENTGNGEINKTNAYEKFLAGQEKLGNAKVPLNGRISFVTYSFYSFIKLDPAFMLASEISKKEIINGMVGMIDNNKIVPLPLDYLPSNTAFLTTHPVATTAANKLESFVTHVNPPGLNGVLIEGRVRYDAFVLNSKKDAIYVHKTAEETLKELTVTSEASATETGKTEITVTPALTSGYSYKYKTAATLTIPTLNTTATAYSAWNGTDEITATTGHKINIVEVDSNNKIKAVGQATVTSKA